MVLATLRFGLNFVRRSATSIIGIGVEARHAAAALRRVPALPARVLRPARDGPGVSRATNDLYPIRYFIGWGVVQSIQSAMMIVGVGIVLALVNPLLALCAGARDAADRGADVALRARA